MKKVKAKFARVHNGLPFFCELELKVERRSDEFRVHFECSGEGFQSQGTVEEASMGGYDDWKAGAKAGIEYAASKAGIVKCLVIVTAIRGLTSDTNPIVVAGASAFAFWDAVDFAINPDLKTAIEAKIFKSWHEKRDAPSLFD